MPSASGTDNELRSSYLQMLRGSALFARLSDEETDVVLSHARIARYRRGQQIVAKGDPGVSMMAVLRGRVAIGATSVEGRQVVLSVLQAGDVFGEIALLDGKERTADATALIDCEILIISRRSFWSLLERRLDLCVDLMLVLCDRLRHTNEQVEDLAFLDLQSRTAKVLLRLLDESGVSQTRTAPATIRISQRALSELVGGSRESINKHLNTWKDLGIVSIEKGAIVVHDLAVLAEYAQ